MEGSDDQIIYILTLLFLTSSVLRCRRFSKLLLPH